MESPDRLIQRSAARWLALSFVVLACSSPGESAPSDGGVGGQAAFGGSAAASAGAGNAGATGGGGAMAVGGSSLAAGGGAGGGAGASQSSSSGEAAGGSAPGGSGGAVGVGGAAGNGAAGGAGGGNGSGAGGGVSARCQTVRSEYAAELEKQLACNPNGSSQCTDRAASAAGCECDVFIEPADPFAIEHLSNIANEWFDEGCSRPSCPAQCSTALAGTCQPDSKSPLGGRCVTP